MKIFWITLEETIQNVVELEIMAESEPQARRNALATRRPDWKEKQRFRDITRVQELIDYS
jgi:hypothetical protein